MTDTQFLICFFCSLILFVMVFLIPINKTKPEFDPSKKSPGLQFCTKLWNSIFDEFDENEQFKNKPKTNNKMRTLVDIEKDLIQAKGTIDDLRSIIGPDDLKSEVPWKEQSVELRAYKSYLSQLKVIVSSLNEEKEIITKHQQSLLNPESFKKMVLKIVQDSKIETIIEEN